MDDPKISELAAQGIGGAQIQIIIITTCTGIRPRPIRAINLRPIFETALVGPNGGA